MVGSLSGGRGHPLIKGAVMSIFSKSFDEPDEQRSPDKTRVDVVKLPGISVARITFQPGWRWSECIKPVVGGDSCQVEHVGYIVSGTLDVRHEDGSGGEARAGMVYR